MSQPLRIAIIPGDGIGPEVVGVATRVLEVLLGELSGGFELVPLEAGWGTFQRTGSALPAETLASARSCQAIVFGAVSSPSGRVAGYSSPILGLRRELDLFANLRPIVSAPLPASRPDIDILLVRENTEGLYSGRERLEDGGEVAIAERVISRRASTRIAEKALALASERGERTGRRPLLTVVHKANVLRETDGLFRDSVLAVAARYPEIEIEEQLVDSMACRLWLEPERYDVVVAPNLYGDILSDAAAALVGGLGLAPSANVGDEHLLVEPVHGSAPDIAGRGIANPIATLRAVVLMLSHLGETRAAARLHATIGHCLAEGPHTPDLGGSASTREVGDAILERLASSSLGNGDYRDPASCPATGNH